jgi:hypothetical protein
MIMKPAKNKSKAHKSNRGGSPAKSSKPPVKAPSTGGSGPNKTAASPPKNTAQSKTPATAPAQNPKSFSAKALTTRVAALKDVYTQGHHEAIVPISIVGGLVGMLVGTLPASLWALLTGRSFPPTYLLLPILVWLGLKVFKGFTGLYGFIVTAAFTLAGFYLTLVSCQAADHIVRYRMSPFSLPLVTAAMIGRSGTLPGPLFSAAYLLPFVFAAVGMALAYELLMHEEKKRIKA